jgi:Secretion system C-terminal sorting domain
VSAAQGNNYINIASLPTTYSTNHLIFSDDEIYLTSSLNNLFPVYNTTGNARLIIRSKKAVIVDAAAAVTISPHIILETGDSPYGSWFPQNQLSIDEVSTFCNERTLDGIVYNADQFDDASKSPSAASDIVAAPKIDFTIYPNPASTYFKIDLNAERQASVNAINIYDISGRLLDNKDYFAEVNNIDFLPSGMYLIEIKCSDYTRIMQRLIIQRNH